MAFYRAFRSGARLRDHNDDVEVDHDDDVDHDFNCDDGGANDDFFSFFIFQIYFNQKVFPFLDH